MDRFDLKAVLAVFFQKGALSQHALEAVPAERRIPAGEARAVLLFSELGVVRALGLCPLSFVRPARAAASILRAAEDLPESA